MKINTSKEKAPEARRFFSLLLHSQVVSQLGSQVFVTAAAIWLTYHSTSGSVALLVSAPTLVALLFTLLGGSLSDAHDRLTLLFYLDLCMGFVNLAVAWWLPATAGPGMVWTLVSLRILLAALGSMHLVTLQTLPAGFANGENSPRQAANVRSRANMQLAAGVVALIAPALAGFLTGRLSLNAVTFINGLSFFYAALVSWWIKKRAAGTAKAAAVSGRPTHSFHLTRMRESVTSILSTPDLKSVFLLLAMVNFCTSPLGLVLGFMVKGSGRSEKWMGLVLSLMALGSIVSSGIFSQVTASAKICTPKFEWLYLSLAAAAMIVAGLFPQYWVWCVSMFILCFASAPLNISLMTRLQTLAPEAMLGRTTASVLVLANVLGPLGCLAAGIVMERWLTPGYTMSALGAGVALCVLRAKCLPGSASSNSDPLTPARSLNFRRNERRT